MIQISHAKAAEKAILTAQKMKIMMFDVDGVLTSGALNYNDDDSEMKSFFAPDGLGIGFLQKAGIIVAIVSGRDSPMVRNRMRDLKIEHVFLGVHNKLEVVEKLLKDLNISFDEAGFMGDDVIDIRPLNACGFAAAPANCIERVKPYVQIFSSKIGGSGAAREICEFILEARGEIDEVMAHFAVSWLPDDQNASKKSC